jgi:DNA repair photolyase
MTLKLIANPPNPYLSEYREWLGPPPPVKVEVYEERAKSLITENDSPDIPFRWSANPYRGCQHACAYCYARPYHEYLGMGAGTDFDTKLVAKVNAAELLRKEVAKPKLRGQPICFSGVTDCYQPIEVTYKLTQQCLRVCLEMGNPVSVITKSFLVMRDAHLLAQLGRVAGAEVYQSIPFADDKLARLIEPQAPPPTKRFEAMRRLTEAGVKVGVMVAPIIPGLNDKEVPEVLRRAAECGATSAGYTALRLPGSVAPIFMERLKAAMPLRAQRVESRIREMRGGALNETRFGKRMRGEGEYWESIRSLFKLSVQRYGLNRPRGALPVNSAGPSTSTTATQTTFDFA